MALTVRPARPGDAAEIARAHVETWRHAYAGLLPQSVLDGLSQRGQTRRWRRAIRDPEGELGQVLLAEESGEAGLLGFGSARVDIGEIVTLYVRPAAQRRGVGRLLLQRLAGLLKGPVSLWVLDGNPAAGFYARMGGRPAVARTVRRWGLDLGQREYRWPGASSVLDEQAPAARPCCGVL